MGGEEHLLFGKLQDLLFPRSALHGREGQGGLITFVAVELSGPVSDLFWEAQMLQGLKILVPGITPIVLVNFYNARAGSDGVSSLHHINMALNSLMESCTGRGMLMQVGDFNCHFSDQNPLSLAIDRFIAGFSAWVRVHRGLSVLDQGRRFKWTQVDLTYFKASLFIGCVQKTFTCPQMPPRNGRSASVWGYCP